MKVKSFFITSLLAIVSLPFLGGCKEETKAPSFAFSPEIVDVSLEGGIVSVAYQIENPVKGAEIIVNCDADWITDFNYETEGQILFNVARNEVAEAREAVIEINYPGAYPVPTFTVRQAIGAPDPFKIEISNISYTSMSVSVIPFDKNMKYLCFIFSTTYLAEFSDDYSLFARDIASFQEWADWTGLSVNEVIDQYAVRGDMSNDIGELYPGTSYVVYVYGIDVDAIERLTDIVRFEVTTETASMIDAKFDIDVKVNGPSADITYTPVNYNGYYYPIVFGDYDESTTEKELSEAITADWMDICNAYRFYLGYSNEKIMQELCETGTNVEIKDLDAETLYVALTAAVNDDALICSEISYKFFTTDAVHHSDNIITINTDDIKSWKATIKLNPSNNDSYTAGFASADEVEGYGDEDIIESMIENPGILHGEYLQIVKPLEPNREYKVFAVGCAAGVATTELFQKSFTTPEAVLSDVKVKIEYNNWADGMAIAGLDPGYAARGVEGGMSFLSMDFSAEPAGIPVYYGLYDAIYFENPDDIPVDAIMNDMLSYNPSELPYEIWTVQYGDEVVGCAVGEDENGNLGELYIGNPVEITEKGALDPAEWLTKYPYLASDPSQAHITRASNFNDVKSNDVLLKQLNIQKHACKKDNKVSNEKQAFRKVSIDEKIIRKVGLIFNHVIKMKSN